MTVISLSEEREKRQSHMSGSMVCMGCKHEWVGVKPLGFADAMECPACHLFKGVPHGVVLPNDVPIWQCSPCGSAFYTLTTVGAMCVGCGKLTEYDELME